jgi:hypothetical protein
MKLFILCLAAGVFLGINGLSVRDRELLKEELRAQLDELEERSFEERGEETVEQPVEPVSACPTCSEGTVCCRQEKEFKCCPKIFDKTFKVGSQIVHEQVEVNKEDNSAKFYLEKGSVGVIDFKKSIAGIYFAEAKACFVIGGISNVGDVDSFLKQFGADAKSTDDAADGEIVFYDAVKDAALKDTSIVPNDLRESCDNLPVYWAEKSKTSKQRELLERRNFDDTNREKRSWNHNGCINIFFMSYCLGWGR